MEPEVYYAHFYRLESRGETVIVPADVLDEEISSMPDAVVHDEGMKHAVRLQRPGYIDCTEWELFDTEEEAEARAAEMLAEENGDEDEDEDEEENGDSEDDDDDTDSTFSFDYQKEEDRIAAIVAEQPVILNPGEF